MSDFAVLIRLRVQGGITTVTFLSGSVRKGDPKARLVTVTWDYGLLGCLKDLSLRSIDRVFAYDLLAQQNLALPRHFPNAQILTGTIQRPSEEVDAKYGSYPLWRDAVERAIGADHYRAKHGWAWARAVDAVMKEMSPTTPAPTVYDLLDLWP